ncbi:MAG: adenylate kinase, adenylate kinase [Candidatus Peregrinibacteria bacterium GW2011_GWF2_33_10]|nr:MAG: adenylate kinase, adenylate kinase [Candidatus Peregrinibacteria bacterium GW2011_GWF2_33_10]OGJ46117.1 MAG: hypothetical protein A2272_05335 [Candidatus Peregrinibacteria bacterium RIFOXYA12_FULL_33_12]OGJ46177.1 MAG: hypothetical protein A2263_04790 [Candidatus Peregrinibacteria bacterium RIFOXYA2_FULL_33_21]OGJ51594.1 MAG: hypothetical protein A2307_03960 [Candidatus Peregrinibacteria bacterium RIFOXYB2_FULL_33_20]
MDIILFGMQGAGKGTQGTIMAKKYNLAIFDTGAQLRALIQTDSLLAEKVKLIMNAGKLVPNEVVMELIENFMEANKSGGILFDGLPRNKEQEESFNSLISKHSRNLKGIYIDLSHEEAVKRLLGRRMCEKCKSIYPIAYSNDNCEKCGGNLVTRPDDNLDSIKTRLDTFKKETLPVIENYEKAGILTRIDGQQSIEKVSEDIFQALGKCF